MQPLTHWLAAQTQQILTYPRLRSKRKLNWKKQERTKEEATELVLGEGLTIIKQWRNVPNKRGNLKPPYASCTREGLALTEEVARTLLVVNNVRSYTPKDVLGSATLGLGTKMGVIRENAVSSGTLGFVNIP